MTLRVLTLIAAVGCGAAGGVFFAFSSFVLAGLQRLPPAQGIAAMQSINVTAVRIPFMLGLFGPAVLCVVLVILALRGDGDSPGLLVIGCGLYLLGTIAVTIGFHVPMNDALAAADPAVADAAERWSSYLSRWGAGNHVRAAAALAASGVLAAAA